MPDFWEFPTVSMGLGPLASVYQARFNRYLQNRGIRDTSQQRVWAFLGDGEMDEPESIAGISLAAREGLDNLTFVINCNLQRLDGPVRGNGKIIQELEGLFRGAGWNVIKVVWGREWDELLARDVDGVLVEKMNETVDGEFQKYVGLRPAPTSASTSSGRTRGCAGSSSTCPTTTCCKLRRGGHDYRKVYAAYNAATEYIGRADGRSSPRPSRAGPSAAGVEARNITHQAKKLTEAELQGLPRPPRAADPRRPSSRTRRTSTPGPDSEEVQYLLRSAARRSAGRSRAASCARSRCPVPSRRVDEEFDVGQRRPRSRRPWSSRGSCATSSATRSIGKRIVPIIPDEARTFGMDPLFKEVGIYAANGQRYDPVDSELVLSYREATGRPGARGGDQRGGLDGLAASPPARRTRRTASR